MREARSREGGDGGALSRRLCTLSNYCSVQELGLPGLPLEQRRYRRINGIQLPLHPQQLLGWFVIGTISVGSFGFAIPILAPELRTKVLALVLSALVVHLISHFAALILDPAELAVRKRPARRSIPEFDRTKHLHVIENGRCHLCNIDATSRRTKHCSICNKCVERFDHHCKWLNNCIGSRNYPAFIVCLVSAVTATLTIVALSVTELTLVSRWRNKTDMDNVTLPIINLPLLPGTGSLIVITLIGLLSAVAAILLIHLCFFHGYIAFLGLTTYEYVRSKQNKQQNNNSLAITNNSSEQRRNGVNGCLNSLGSSLSANRYHCCENVNSADASRDSTSTRNIYFCSTHTASATQAQITQRQSVGNNVGYFNDDDTTTTTTTTTIQRSEKERRNFHLYFSYDSRFNETSIQLTSSQNSSAAIVNDGTVTTTTTTTMTTTHNNRTGHHPNHPNSLQIQQIQQHDRPSLEQLLKPSTPSPVSCCFSIMGPSSTASLEKAKQRKLRQANAAQGVFLEAMTNDKQQQQINRRSSCTTMRRRIQTFLRTRLRKNTTRERAIDTEICNNARKNKIEPTGFEVESTSPVSSSSTNSLEQSVRSINVEPAPLRLPPLSLPPLPRNRLLNKNNELLLTPETMTLGLPTVNNKINKNRSQSASHLRVRRATLGHKRQRFGAHLSQSAQLSPIPESELSKPASPRSPPMTHFNFPPLTNSSAASSSSSSSIASSCSR